MIDFKWYGFSDLSVEQLYAALTLRSDIFVVEQNCAYLDPDGKDPSALHLLGMENGVLVTYLRLFAPLTPGNPLIFGRVVTAKSARGNGYGKDLMKELLVYCEREFPGVSIHCSAQNYLREFYKQFGFKIYGEIYQEDGIPHIEMRR